MSTYDPNKAPDPREWLALDEQLRIDLAREFHRAAGIELHNVTAHAAFHAIVENQLAMQHPPVVRSMERLRKEGLSRHDCVHAIGSVLARHLHDLITTASLEAPSTAQARYDAAVERLSAAGWRAQVEE